MDKKDSEENIPKINDGHSKERTGELHTEIKGGNSEDADKSDEEKTLIEKLKNNIKNSSKISNRSRSRSDLSDDGNPKKATIDENKNVVGESSTSDSKDSKIRIVNITEESENSKSKNPKEEDYKTGEGKNENSGMDKNPQSDSSKENRNSENGKTDEEEAKREKSSLDENFNMGPAINNDSNKNIPDKENDSSNKENSGYKVKDPGYKGEGGMFIENSNKESNSNIDAENSGKEDNEIRTPKKLENLEEDHILIGYRNEGRVVAEGWFYKKRPIFSCFWHRKYFILLDDGNLFYLKEDGRRDPKGNWNIKTATNYRSYYYDDCGMAWLQTPHPNRIIFDLDEHTELYFGYENANDSRYWMKVLSEKTKSLSKK